MDFLEEDSPGNLDFRNLRVSTQISLGAKFQRNSSVRICAQAGLRKGVDASAMSLRTICMVKPVSACFILAWRFFFLGPSRTSVLKALHKKKWKTKRQAVQEDHTCAWFAFGGPTSPRIGVQWVFRPSTTTPKLTTTQPWLSRWIAASPGLVKVRPLQEF